jgi:hypothetical protein
VQQLSQFTHHAEANMKNVMTKLLSVFLVFSLTAWTLPPQAMARMIGTEEAASAQTATAPVDRGALIALLERADVRQQLEALGVDPRDARARVDALTDEQARDLAARMDEMPAGGASILGVLFTIFIILLVTDILGFTRIFPFTRPVR